MLDAREMRNLWRHCRLSYRNPGESEYAHRARSARELDSMGYSLHLKLQENGCEALLTRRLCVRDEWTVAIRGTERSRSGIPWWMRLVRSEWAVDALGWMVEDGELEGRIHQGFKYHSDPMLESLVDVLVKNGCERANFTGHSLGGAVASRLAGVCGVKGIPVGNLVTFGAPAVGDLEWADRLERIVGRAYCWRVVNCGDVIPRLKTQRLWSMLQMSSVRHAGQLVYLNRFGRAEENANGLDMLADRLSARMKDWSFYQLGYEHHSVEAYDSAVHVSGLREH